MATRYWIILAAIGAAFGASFAFNEVLLGPYGPLTVSALRLSLGALGCWAWVVATGRRARVSPAVLAGLVIFGVFQFAAPFALLPLAQEHITSSAAGIANALTPAAVVIISHVWPGGERVTRNKLLGVALGVAGIAVLATRGAEIGETDPRFVVVAVAAPVCYGIALNIVRWFRTLDLVVVTAWAMSGGAVAIAPVALAVEGIPAVPGDVGVAAALATIGFGLTTVTFLVMYSVLPRVGATNLSLVTLVAPVSATCIGALALHETIGVGHVAGAALLLAGLAVIDGRLLSLIEPAWLSRLSVPLGPDKAARL
jgi:drug/metabolite transporter (DMT)-like permease